MNWLDLLIAVIIALPVIFGFRKGFLRKILGIAGIIIGFILAVRFYQPISSLFSDIVKTNSNWVPVISFLLIIGIVFVLSIWVAKFIAGINSGTKMIDKILGAVFGLIQGLILSSIIVINFTYLNLPEKNIRDSSYFYPIVYKIAPAIFDRVLDYSPDLKNLYEEYKKILLTK